MPWIPELFSTPASARLRERTRSGGVAAVPYVAGLMAGDIDALSGSFAGSRSSTIRCEGV